MTTIPNIVPDPRHWGPHAWTYFHHMTFSYPDPATPDDKQRYLLFFQAFAQSLPCMSCRKHFTQLISQHPPDMRSRSDLVIWGIAMHNHVNKKLNKPQKSVAEVVALYQKPHQFDEKPDLPIWPLFVLAATGMAYKLSK
jgi:hypothetical protein